MLEFIAGHTSEIILAEWLGLIALFSFWESRRPFVARVNRDRGKRHVSHCLLMVVNYATGIGAGWFLAWYLAFSFFDSNYAPIPIMSAPYAVAFVAGLFLLDLSQYVRHRIMHLRWFWRVHQVHHSDRDLDWSTEFRFHPIEVLVSAPIQVFVIAVFGIPGEIIAMYAVMALAIGVLQHSNIELPTAVERWCGTVLVTPALHRVHHADRQQCYDRNFAVIFVLWDRLLGTFRRAEDEREFGLPGLRDPATGLTDLLASPFRDSRP